MIKIEITNSFCKNEVVSEMISRVVLAIALSVIMLIGSIFKEKDITFFIVILITVLLIIFLGIILLLLKKSAILRKEFYIVEDVLIHVFKNGKYHSMKGGYTTQCYIAKFSKNGEYKIAFYSKDGAGASRGDYGIVRNSEPGDKIYLVMSNKNKILQCYNAKDYTISEEEFELRDGKYYLKGNMG